MGIGILLVLGGAGVLWFVRELGPEKIFTCTENDVLSDVGFTACDKMYATIDFVLIGIAVIAIAYGVLRVFGLHNPKKG